MIARLYRTYDNDGWMFVMEKLMILFDVMPLDELMLLVMLLALCVLWLFAISKIYVNKLPIFCAVAAIFLPMMVYLVSVQGAYERMTPEAFTKYVVNAVPNFVGTSHCTKKGVAIVGEYQLTAQVGSAQAKPFKVAVNLLIPELAYACEKGYYPNSPLKWRSLVHEAALVAVNGNVLDKKYGTVKVL